MCLALKRQPGPGIDCQLSVNHRSIVWIASGGTASKPGFGSSSTGRCWGTARRKGTGLAADGQFTCEGGERAA